ncbi:hypothetical protein P4C99_19120 [Pontiellaceae bacterium B1224]|nr:hypothetical protein [Pontiellaceae bacterium B1224]
MRNKLNSYAVALFALAIGACMASADIYNYGTDVESAFAEAIDDDNDALFETASLSNVSASVFQFNDEDVKDNIVRLENGLSSMKEIVFYAREKLDSSVELEGDLLEAIESVWRQLSGSAATNILIRPTSWEIDGDSFVLELGPQEQILNFQTTYLDNVASAPAAYTNAIDTLGILQLTYQTLNYVKRKNAVGEIGAVAEERKAQWDVYFNESIPQWPWELALVNGPIYAHSLKNEKGFGKVPEWQMIVAHPDLAIEYVKDAADGDQFMPALLIEIIGANFWIWEDGDKQKGPWGFPVPLGAGVVATYSDRAGIDDWGFGAVIHIDNVYNIGATFRGSDTGVFFSLNLAKLFENKSNEAKKYLNMIGM